MKGVLSKHKINCGEASQFFCLVCVLYIGPKTKLTEIRDDDTCWRSSILLMTSTKTQKTVSCFLSCSVKKNATDRSETQIPIENVGKTCMMVLFSQPHGFSLSFFVPTLFGVGKSVSRISLHKWSFIVTHVSPDEEISKKHRFSYVLYYFTQIHACWKLNLLCASLSSYQLPSYIFRLPLAWVMLRKWRM